MNELGCAYQKYAKCESCEYVTYRDCFKFRLWRAKYLLNDILPLKLTAEDQKYKGLPGRVYYSVNESRAKKFVASTSIKLDKQLRSMSLSQAITLALEPSELTHKVYYIQCFTRGGDKEKVQPCLESFVDRMLLENCVVVICAKSGIISCAESWVNLDKSSKSAE